MRNSRRTYSLPARAISRCLAGSAITSRQRSAHSAAELTRYPVTPSSICSGMPPTSPPMVGRAFHSASVTVRPKPSRSDFWMTTSAWLWKALTSTEPTLSRLESTNTSGSSPT